MPPWSREEVKKKTTGESLINTKFSSPESKSSSYRSSLRGSRKREIGSQSWAEDINTDTRKKTKFERFLLPLLACIRPRLDQNGASNSRECSSKSDDPSDSRPLANDYDIIPRITPTGSPKSPSTSAMRYGQCSSAGSAEMLRDLTQTMNVALLAATVDAFYRTGSYEERTAVDSIFRNLQNNQHAWLQVVHILQNTQNLNTKFFALQVLEGVIKYRWNSLPVEQRNCMKNYIFEVIVKLSSDENSFRREKLYVNKLNVILVQILKREWPARWLSFIPDLVAAAKTNEIICENCMAILKFLSEDVFDFSWGEMTQQKIEELKSSLNSEFHLIHELFLFVLSGSPRAELVRATLATLHAFLSWIPGSYIFESPLLDTLLRYFQGPAYPNLTLECLIEVAARNFQDNMQYVKMYTTLMLQLQLILLPTTDIPQAYVNGNTEEQAFIQNLALFFTSFYKYHIRILESSQQNMCLLILGFEYLIKISYVDDTEVFKVCLDYWNSLVSELLEAADSAQPMQVPQLYAEPMSKLRLLMICRMAKPEDVLIVEDDDGNIVRETLKDNDVLVQNEIMRETLMYLSHLDKKDTEKQMLDILNQTQVELNEQLDKGVRCSWNKINTLCWAIGSISGSMGEDQETSFLVMVINGLLNLFDVTTGKDNKAVIASNIMYVVGQYPGFLRANWEFLKTFVHKLFEYMRETHPEVQDMACDTFLKIVQKCKRNFVEKVRGDEPFLSKHLTALPTNIAGLKLHQIHSFYESVGTMIHSEYDPHKRDEYLQRLMELPNQKWAEIIGRADESTEYLKDPDIIRSVLHILQINTRVATSLGKYFLPQITIMFSNMLNVYRMYSELISTDIVAQGGPCASRTSAVKLLRSVKRETLKLIETFVPHIGRKFEPHMLDDVLGDYARNLPDARESEVLSLFATIINNYKGEMIKYVPQIFEAVFQCTLEMITKNFEDYPVHRLKFFSLLCAIETHCFPALIHLSSKQLKLVMDSIIWAFHCTESNITETGLNLLLEMMKKFQTSEFCNQFYMTYFVTIEQEIFAVLTDTFHKSGFKLHVLVLQHLFCLLEYQALTEPLWDAATVQYPYPNNSTFAREYTITLLCTSFPNITSAEVTQFVTRLFESRSDLGKFRDQVRDFLVQSKEFSAQNKDIMKSFGWYLRNIAEEGMLCFVSYCSNCCATRRTIRNKA